MLEELRQCVAYDSDKTNLVRTANYLWLKISRNELLQPDNRQMLMDLFERYANAVLKAKYSDQPSTLFPPNSELETLMEGVIQDTANFLFAQYYFSLSDSLKATSYLESISQVGQSKDDVKALAEKVIGSGNFKIYSAFRFESAPPKMRPQIVWVVSRWWTKSKLSRLRRQPSRILS